MADTPDEVSAELDVEEVECEEASDRLELPDEELRVAEELEGEGPEAMPPEALQAIDEAVDLEDDEAAEDALAAAFKGLRTGGRWGGCQWQVYSAIRIGKRNGLQVTSTKRKWGSSRSDHHASQKSSFAADLSNGSRPTPQMDRAARQIAAMLGVRKWGYGELARIIGPYRWQVLYRTNVGGNHYNHVHVGCRRVRR